MEGCEKYAFMNCKKISRRGKCTKGLDESKKKIDYYKDKYWKKNIT